MASTRPVMASMKKDPCQPTRSVRMPPNEVPNMGMIAIMAMIVDITPAARSRP